MGGTHTLQRGGPPPAEVREKPRRADKGGTTVTDPVLPNSRLLPLSPRRTTDNRVAVCNRRDLQRSASTLRSTPRPHEQMSGAASNNVDMISGVLNLTLRFFCFKV